MLRFLGVVVLLLVAVAGLAYYLGWFTVSTSQDRQNPAIEIKVDREKIKADEEAAKKKLESVKPATSTNKQ